jgi:hypothetical protein
MLVPAHWNFVQKYQHLKGRPHVWTTRDRGARGRAYLFACGGTARARIGAEVLARGGGWGESHLLVLGVGATPRDGTRGVSFILEEVDNSTVLAGPHLLGCAPAPREVI